MLFKLNVRQSLRTVLAITILSSFLSACGPVMRSVTDYDPPATEAGLQCVSRANESLDICKSENAIAFQQCSDQAAVDADKAYIAARDIYAENLEIYIYAQERYELKYQKYEHNQQLLISKGELDYIRCSKDVNMLELDKHPSCKPFLDEARKRADDVREPRRPAKPYAPNRVTIFNALRAECHVTQKNCAQIFDQSYRYCGGTISTRQVCVKNCD